MDRSSRLKDIFFNNLLLLGFNKVAIEKEYRVTCDKNMFSVPNQKMFEAVTQFLFSKLKRKYVLPWPLLDKDHHRQFQKLTYNYLSTIAQESNVKFPRITPSLISTFSGERFYELYVAFSSHVVEQQIKANNNVELILCPKVSTLNCKNVIETLRIETVLSTEKSQHIQKLSREYFEEVLKYANDYRSLFKILKSNLIANCSKYDEQVTHLCSLYSENSTSDDSIKNSLKKGMEFQTKVKKHWALLEKFLLKEKELWSYLSPVVAGKNEKYVLDSTHVKVTVPDIIKKEHSEELNAMEVNSVVSEENEKPDLLRYMKIFIIILETYLKSYKTGDVSNIHSLCNVENTLNLDQILSKMNFLSEKIAKDVLPSVKESTKNLHENLLVPELSEDLEDFIKECPSWNFNSKSFHERMKFCRSKASLPFSNEDENLKLSLLSSAEASCNLDESSSSKESFGTCCSSENLSTQSNSLASPNLEPVEPLKDDTNTFRSLNDLKEPVFEESLLTILCKESTEKMNEFLPKNVLPDNFQKSYLPDANVCAVSPLPDILIDFNIDYSKPFKMRESWHLEDSLQATTFPDDSLID